MIVAAAGGAAAARVWPGGAPAPSASLFVTASPPAAVAVAPAESALRPKQPPRALARAALRAVVYVAGEVAHPGVYALPKTARGSDAVHAAGGPSRAADLVAVNLAAPIEDGAEIIVPSKGSAAADDAVTVLQTADAASQRPPRRRSTHHRKRRAHHAAVSAAYAPDGPNASDGAGMAPTLISLNTADVTALEALPGIGAALAARVVAFRDANGPFASLDELLDVNGITQAKLDALTPLVRL